jgi:hypothetical protein
MNERIKDLAEQCWEPKQYGPPWFNSRKFAELIVRECLTFVEPMPGSGDIDDLALEAAREGIKEHFGVEE